MDRLMKQFLRRCFPARGFNRGGAAAKLFFVCLAVVSVCFMPLPAEAQDPVAVQAEVSARTVALDQYIRLTVTATGVRTLDPVTLPEIDGFQARFVGPSSRVSIINGAHSSSYALLYDLYPQKTGSFVIPSLTVIIQGKGYQTDEIPVEVVSSSAQALPFQNSGSGGAASSPIEALSDRLFLVMTSPYHDVYLNQKVPVIVRLYIGGVSVRNVEYPQIASLGFLIDDFEEPRQLEEVVNGIRYTVLEFRTSVYPTRIGEMSLGPAVGRCQLLMRNPSRARRSGSRGLFDDDFFSGFFDSYTSQPAEMESEPLVLNVNPLPESGRPEGFSGAVGKFAFHASVSPVKVKVGDPVTVRMTAAGNGSLRTFELPAFQSGREFRAYDPVVREENGVKVLEQVLIPQSSDVSVVPEIVFSFFDPEENQYRTVSHGPVALEVEPVESGREFRVVGLGHERMPRRDDIGRDISFIKSDAGNLRTPGYAAFRSFGFVIGLIVIALAWAGGVLFYHFTDRLKTDERFAKRLQAPGHARRGLKNLRMYLDRNDADGFYNELFKTLERYFAHKCHMPPGAVTAGAVQREIERRGARNGIAARIQEVFDECEAARYASAGFSRQQMERTYQAVREIIDWFERKV